MAVVSEELLTSISGIEWALLKLVVLDPSLLRKIMTIKRRKREELDTHYEILLYHFTEVNHFRAFSTAVSSFVWFFIFHYFYRFVTITLLLHMVSFLLSFFSLLSSFLHSFFPPFLSFFLPFSLIFSFFNYLFSFFFFS